MAKNNIYKPLRRKHGEGTGKFATFGLKQEVADEFRLLVQAYSEVYGQKITPTQIIKRFIDSCLKRCDPDVFRRFNELKEDISPMPSLEIVHPIDPTEGPVWEMKYFVEKDGEQREMHVGDRQPFYGIMNGRNVGLWKFLQEGWTFMNEAGIEITEDQASIIANIIRRRRCE